MAEITGSRDRRDPAQNRKLFYSEAKKYIAGGVNSPVRSFKSVGGYPVFINRARGATIYDESGSEYIDYCLSWGALILGHARPEVVESLKQAVEKGTSFGTVTKLETELARLITEAIPSVERVRLTGSGTEAVMGAIRLARAYTGRDKILKFEGSYHGHADYLLAKSGSGKTTLGIPDAAGVPKDFTKHTIVVPYNNIGEVERLAEANGEELAAIIVEPVAANCGVIPPGGGFLNSLRDIADRHETLLVFDEVITGFRLSYGGAQEYFNVKPDLTSLGKIVGGGLPLAAFGGRNEIMKLLAPEGDVYQAGTLSGNPIAVTAGITTLNILRSENPYRILEDRTKKLCDGIEKIAKEQGVKLKTKHIGSMFSLFFTEGEVIDYATAKTQDVNRFKRFYHSLLKEGVYLSPSGFEANFISTAHKEDDINKTLDIIKERGAL